MFSVRLLAACTMKCAVCFCSALSLLSATTGVAQPIAPGTRVRISSIDASVKRSEGTFVKSSTDSIWIISKKSGAEIALSLREALSVEQSTHYKRRQWRAGVGAGVGALVAAAAGELYLKASDNGCGCEADGVGVVAGALLVGAPLGAAIGAMNGGEDWKQVPRPLTVSVRLPAQRQVAFLSIQF